QNIFQSAPWRFLSGCVHRITFVSIWKRETAHRRCSDSWQLRERKSRDRAGECCDILRARLRECSKRSIKMLDRRNFMKTCSGMGLGNTVSRSFMGASPSASSEEDYQGK